MIIKNEPWSLLRGRAALLRPAIAGLRRGLSRWSVPCPAIAYLARRFRARSGARLTDMRIRPAVAALGSECCLAVVGVFTTTCFLAVVGVFTTTESKKLWMSGFLSVGLSMSL